MLIYSVENVARSGKFKEAADQVADHFQRPQAELEIELLWMAQVDAVVDLLDLRSAQLPRTPRALLLDQPVLAFGPKPRQPVEDCALGNVEDPGHLVKGFLAVDDRLDNVAALLVMRGSFAHVYII